MEGLSEKLLFVCTRGRDRSRTAAEVVAETLPDIETRYGGVLADADRPVNAVDVAWADTIICMEPYHRNRLRRRFKGLSRKIRVWGIADEHLYREPGLVALIHTRLQGL